MLKQKWIKITLFIIIEFIIFITLYFNLIYSLKRQYKEFGCSENIQFGNWDFNTMITNELEELFLKETGISNDNTNSIDINKNINISIGKDKKDQKTKGICILKANYSKTEDLEKQFRQFDIEIKYNSTYNRPIYIIKQTNFVATINLYSENTCEIIFVTYLPYYYKIQEINNESCEPKVKYFIKENEKNRMEMQGRLKKEKIKIIKYMIIANCIIMLLYVLFKIISKLFI